jgi:hypothetical protein
MKPPCSPIIKKLKQILLIKAIQIVDFIGIISISLDIYDR